MGTTQRRNSEKEIEQIRMVLSKQVSKLQATVKSATPEFRYLTDDYKRLFVRIDSLQEIVQGQSE